MAGTFIMPGKIISGSGALDQAASEFGTLGKKALVVSDGTMEKLGNVAQVTKRLEENGIGYSVYAKVDREPTDVIVMEGLEQYRAEACDFLIAIGGGSPMDSMKAIAMLAALGGDPADYMGKSVEAELPGMAAIPTTAGTGSEATQFTIITDTRTEVKMLLKGSSLMPDLAVIDPMFTMTAPAGITAATGVDALTHAVEAYTSKKAQSMSDTFALSAVRRIFRNLKKVYDEPGDVEGRTQMSIAALEAGVAFNNASVTIVHGMSRPIGALFHVPHGVSNAMLLKVCLTYVMDGAVERFADLARNCSMAEAGTPDREAAEIFIENVAGLLADLKIPTPEEFGIKREAFMAAVPKMAADAAASGSPSNTRKEITAEAMEMLYRKLWD